MGVCGESLSASWRETGDARAETRLAGQLQIVYAWQHPFFRGITRPSVASKGFFSVLFLLPVPFFRSLLVHTKGLSHHHKEWSECEGSPSIRHWTLGPVGFPLSAPSCRSV